MLKILREALASWDATESDLADAASIFMVPPPEAFHSSSTATQAVVDALIRIVGAERPQSALTSPPLADRSAATSGMVSSIAAAQAAMLELVAEFVTAGRATVQLRDALPILECLATPAKVQSLGASYHMHQSRSCHRLAAYPCALQTLLCHAHLLGFPSWAQCDGEAQPKCNTWHVKCLTNCLMSCRAWAFRKAMHIARSKALQQCC